MYKVEAMLNYFNGELATLHQEATVVDSSSPVSSSAEVIWNDQLSTSVLLTFTSKRFFNVVVSSSASGENKHLDGEEWLIIAVII